MLRQQVQLLLALFQSPSGEKTMKTYGARPHDKAVCAYGCCGGLLTSARQGSKGEKAARKAARKRARQAAKKEIEA